MSHDYGRDYASDVINNPVDGIEGERGGWSGWASMFSIREFSDSSTWDHGSDAYRWHHATPHYRGKGIWK